MKKGLLFLSVVFCLILSTTVAMAGKPVATFLGSWTFQSGSNMFCADEYGQAANDPYYLTGTLNIRSGAGFASYENWWGDSDNPDLHPITAVITDTYNITAVLGGDKILEGRMDRKGEIIYFTISDINTGTEDGFQCSGGGSLIKELDP